VLTNILGFELAIPSSCDLPNEAIEYSKREELDSDDTSAEELLTIQNDTLATDFELYYVISQSRQNLASISSVKLMKNRIWI